MIVFLQKVRIVVELSQVNAEVNTFKISKKVVDDAGMVQEEMCIFMRTRWHFKKHIKTNLFYLLHAQGGFHNQF